MKEIEIKTEGDLKVVLYQNYMAQIKNFLGNEERAMKFLSSVMADVQRNPALLECTPISVINSYMTMAQLGFMPSGVSGEAYVLPYKKNRKIVINGKESWSTETQAQFQMGYQGLVTLFYQAGVEKITSDIVRKNDKTKFVNG
jgi:recombination protein RecT